MTGQTERFRRWYRANRERHMQTVRAWERRHPDTTRAMKRKAANKRNATKREVVRAAKSRPCADCGRTYPYYIMDFDHRPGVEKLFLISKDIPSMTVAQIEAEIAKCDVICAICHRIREHRRRAGNGVQ